MRLIALLSFFAFSLQAGEMDSTRSAQLLFRRLAGVPLRWNDPRLLSMKQLLEEGKPLEAAKIATKDDAFLRVTMRNFATPLGNQEFSPYENYTDFVALFLGTARDDLDSRELLTANYKYTVPYESTRNVGEMMKQQFRDESEHSYSAGLLTTEAWAAAHLQGGTNRRAVKYALQVFLCTPINEWREKDIPEHYIRRDVDRFPGKNHETYQNLCSTCHARMDAMAGAFARLDFVRGRLTHSGPYIMKKMNQNATVAKDGHAVMDDSWEVLSSDNLQDLFGFRGELTGSGPKSFGALLAGSDRFKSCLSERAFEQVCRRPPSKAEKKTLIPEVASHFEKSGFRLKALFEKVSSVPDCVHNSSPGRKPQLTLANFREATESMAEVTGIPPTTPVIAKFVREAQTRFPKTGKKEELSQSSLLTLASLGALFCQQVIAKDKSLAPEKRLAHGAIDFSLPVSSFSPEQQTELIEAYAGVFWQRKASIGERVAFLKAATQLSKSAKPSDSWENYLLPLCASVTASLETWVR